MKKSFGIVAISALLLMGGCVTPGTSSKESVSAVSKSYKDIEYPSLDFKAPKTNRVVLKNGMVLHLLENRELPIVEITSMVKIGGMWEPAEKRGLASLAGSVWRAGGTKTSNPDDLDERLEFIAASIETSIGEKSGSVSLSVLKKDIDEGLSLFADVIKNPLFDEKRFKVAKESFIEGLRRENDDPSEISRREFKRIIYQNHILGVPPTVESVNRITVEDCKKFLSENIGPESFIFGVTGDFDSGEMVAAFEKLFADFKPASKKLPAVTEIPQDVNEGVYVFEKNRPQTVIRAGHFGVKKKSPDYYPVRVMNYILGGGGFSSRLMREIRSTRGLAYSVWSYYTDGYDESGLYILGGETKSSTVYEFLNESGKIMRDIIEDGVTEEELRIAKSSIVNSYVHAFEKDSSIVSTYLSLEYFQMPEDYLEKFRDRINEVDHEKVKAAAKKYLHPDNMVIVAVGDTKEMGENLGKLGKIKNMAIPE